MKSCAIYYPYIKVPQSSWFTRVLLYWDEIGAIVPYEYIENPDRLGHYMVKLVQEQLVTQVIPSVYLSQVTNFEDAFINYVDQKARQPKQSNRLYWASIHMEKLDKVADKLCERGLAKRKPHSSWYKVEPKTADDFMAYLAGVLGQLAGHDKFYPITDQEDWTAPFMPKSTPNMRDLPLRKLILEGILPAPSKAVEPAQLADFKQKYKVELQRFRNEVENRISELSVIDDDNYRCIRLDDIVRNMQESIRELTSKMAEQKNWPHLNFGHLCTIIGSGITACKALINQDWGFGLTGAALSLAPVVYNAFRGSNIDLENKPLAYAALAGRKFAQS